MPVAPRKDGWTPQRQGQFIGMLAQTGCVLAAARAVSMGRESAYRLRKRPGAAGFAAAWDAALGKPRAPVDIAGTKATGLGPGERYHAGRLQVVMHRGRFVSVVRKTDDSALLQYLRRLDRACANAEWPDGKPHVLKPERADEDFGA